MCQRGHLSGESSFPPGWTPAQDKGAVGTSVDPRSQPPSEEKPGDPGTSHRTWSREVRYQSAQLPLSTPHPCTTTWTQPVSRPQTQLEKVTCRLKPEGGGLGGQVKKVGWGVPSSKGELGVAQGWHLVIKIKKPLFHCHCKNVDNLLNPDVWILSRKMK